LHRSSQFDQHAPASEAIMFELFSNGQRREISVLNVPKTPTPNAKQSRYNGKPTLKVKKPVAPSHDRQF
jgi:hypothetical protein